MLADDERRHAELAWRTLAWLVTQRPGLAHRLAGLAAKMYRESTMPTSVSSVAAGPELVVLERLEQLKTASAERRALTDLSRQLRAWRRDPQLESHSRSIIFLTKRRTG